MEIDSSLLQEDKEMLEDLIAAAANDAVKRVGEKVQETHGRYHRRHSAAAGDEAAVLIIGRLRGKPRPVVSVHSPQVQRCITMAW